MTNNTFSRLEWLIPLMITLGAIFMAYGHYEEEQSQVAERDERLAQSVKMKMDLAIQSRIAVVDATADAIALSKNLTRQDFAKLTIRLLPRSPDLYAIQWIPELTYDQLLPYREEAHRDHFFGFSFKQLDLKSFELLPVTPNDGRVYAPIVYTEPRHLTVTAMGFDLMSSPARKRLLDLAKASDETVISEPIRLVEETQDRASFLLTRYVNHGDYKGWVMGVWRVPEFMDDALFDLNIAKSELILKDVTDAEPVNLYPFFKQDVALHDHAYIQLSAPVANRLWHMLLGKHLQDRFFFEALAVALGGIGLAIALGYALRNMRLHNNEIEKGEMLSLKLQNAAELKEQLEIFKRYLDISPIPVVTIEGNKQYGQCVYANDEALRCLGYTSSELIGSRTTDWIFVSEEDRNRYMKAAVKSVKTGVPMCLETPLSLGHNQVGLFEVHGRFVMDGDQLKGTLFLLDIAERKRFQETQEALLESERKLAQSRKLQAMGNLLGGMSHSLNNQLQPILVLLSLLKLRTNEDVKVAEYVSKMESAVNSAIDILQRTLSASRSEYGNNRADIMTALPNSLQIAALGVGSNIKFDTSEIAPLQGQILLDQVDLDVILLNLINNAKDAIGVAQGKIKVSSRLCEPDVTRVKTQALLSQPWVCICVQDDGEGMSAEQLERILDPFFTTKPVGQGTGLGMSETQGLVLRAGGYIEIISSEGEGASICLHLPVFKTDNK